MDAVRLGAICRALRIKKRWRQVDLARRAGVARSAISDIETGHVERMRVETLLLVIDALGGRIDFVVRWQGGELDRLLNARHSALHESVARAFRRLAAWETAPEVSFNIRGERGIIDILAWHAATRTLLVIELKTDIVDVNELVGTLGRKVRLAHAVARDRGWEPAVVASWLIVADSTMNRRRVATHSTMLRELLPDRGQSMGVWLRQPTGSRHCLSFWANDAPTSSKSVFATVRRVRRPVTGRG